ncbi:beta-microseminoprotein-like [Dendrobates tinctorius]|uniref:beta-microseminoprotein-like n=1 Tax=Dendrobates tinctorius TaxID=92724 RepID=UPI003CC92CFD
MMKYSLIIALFGAGILVGVCNAACAVMLNERQTDPGGCIYDGKLHEYGSVWRTKNCQRCVCYGNGDIQCCDSVGRPVGYDKEKCKEVFYEEACVYIVVRKDNPKRTCKHAMVG